MMRNVFAIVVLGLIAFFMGNAYPEYSGIIAQSGCTVTWVVAHMLATKQCNDSWDKWLDSRADRIDSQIERLKRYEDER